jgi:hypothetical protein
VGVFSRTALLCSIFLESDFEPDFDSDFDLPRPWYRDRYRYRIRVDEQRSVNPAERLSAQGLIVVAVREIYFPTNARRSMRHGKSGAGIAIEIEIQIEIQKIGRDTRIREKNISDSL